jgi:hypothetical protein
VLTRAKTEEGQGDKAAKAETARKRAEEEARLAQELAAEKTVENDALIAKLKEQKRENKQLQRELKQKENASNRQQPGLSCKDKDVIKETIAKTVTNLL